MRKMTIVCAAILVLFALFVGYIFFGVNSAMSWDIAYYQALSGETDGKDALWIFPWGDYVQCPYDLPQLSELGEYQALRFVHNAKRYSLFAHHAYVLIAEYDSQAYEAQKQAMEQRYEWCTEENEAYVNGDMSEFTYTMDEFTIRAVDGGGYPHEMLFVGCSDSRQEIAIIYFYDQDLDVIDEPLGKFIEEKTGWSKVV